MEFRIEQFSCKILSHIFWKVLEIANCCLPLGGLDDFIAELNPSYGACGSKSEESSRNKSQYLCIYNYIYLTSQAHSRCKCHWNIWARILCGNNWEGSRTLNLEDTDWSHRVYLGLSLWMNILLSRHFGKQALWAILCARLAISVARIYIMAMECFYIKTKGTHDQLKRDWTFGPSPLQAHISPTTKSFLDGPLIRI